MRGGGSIRVVTISALAALGILAGCGGEEPQAPPFTAADTQVGAECLFGTYLPEAVGQRAAARPVPGDWRRIEEAPGALQPDRAAAVLTLRPRRPGVRVVLTDVRLDVKQHLLRPLGTVFYRPCDRRLRGPAIEADLDGAGRVGATSAALGGTIGPGLRLPEQARPIRFPWTIRLDRPLRIYFVAHGEHCFCTWRFRIPWHSGSASGTIRLDNGGRGYTLTDSIGMPWNRPGPDGRWVQVPMPAWTGVR